MSSLEDRRSYHPPIKTEQREREHIPFVTAEATRASEKHPERNEDASFVDAENGLIILSDGAGGQESGEKMSREAVRLAREAAPHMVGRNLDELNRSMEAEFRKIIEEGEKFSKKLTSPGGKTASATLMIARMLETPSGCQAIIKSVGDSQAFIQRADGTIERVKMEDDGMLDLWVKKDIIDLEAAELISEATGGADFAAELLRKNFGTDHQILEAFRIAVVNNGEEIEKAIPDLKKTKKNSLEDRRLLRLVQTVRAFKLYFDGHFRSKVTQMVGMSKEDLTFRKDFAVHTAFVPNLRKGDRIILVSDGVSDNLPTRKIGKAMKGDNLQAQLENLRDTALDASRDPYNMRRKSDDITAVAIEVPGEKKVEIAPVRPPARPQGLLGKMKRILFRDSVASPEKISEAQARAKELAERTGK
ncbi:MAG: protein phosphatase 2C domain-containing protein [Patescibacteria group bacterium]|jgi:serine/threonine protein phosphatase PrpC